jgi:flagellar biosynthesis GTPase FlhF
MANPTESFLSFNERFPNTPNTIPQIESSSSSSRHQQQIFEDEIFAEARRRLNEEQREKMIREAMNALRYKEESEKRRLQSEIDEKAKRDKEEKDKIEKAEKEERKRMEAEMLQANRERVQKAAWNELIASRDVMFGNRKNILNFHGCDPKSGIAEFISITDCDREKSYWYMRDAPGGQARISCVGSITCPDIWNNDFENELIPFMSQCPICKKQTTMKLKLNACSGYTDQIGFVVCDGHYMWKSENNQHTIKDPNPYVHDRLSVWNPRTPVPQQLDTNGRKAELYWQSLQSYQQEIIQRNPLSDGTRYYRSLQKEDDDYKRTKRNE